jgi:uncharacterized protein (TIGR03382 family)
MQFSLGIYVVDCLAFHFIGWLLASHGVLDDYSMSVYERAVFYHFVHALGILLTAALDAASAIPRGRAGLANGLLLAGIVFFSGSLYVLALTGQRWLGAVTPIGGVAFIAAWLVLAWAALGRRAER